MGQPPNLSRQNNSNRWLLACGVGCGALALLAVLGVVAGFTAIRYGFDQATSEMRPELAKMYTNLQEEEKLPTEHADVFDRIYQAGMNEESSFWTLLMAFIILPTYLEDGEVSYEEAENALTLADFLEANPDVGFVGFGEFVEDHPEFNEMFQDAQRTFEDYESSGGWEPDPDFEEEFSVPEEVEESVPEESDSP